MAAAWALVAAAIVAAASATEGTGDPITDLDAYPEFERGLEQYKLHNQGGHRHHQHRHLRSHHHKMALAHHSAAPRLNWNPDDNGAPVAEKAAATPMMLPGRHPSVEKVLHGMTVDLEDLKDKQVLAKQSRGELEGKVSEAVHHMNDAMPIKHAIAQKKAQIRVESTKLMNLERSAKHMEETHSSLVSSLHRVLEPKLEYARARLAKKEMVLEKEEQAAKGWQEKKDQIHAHAIEVLKEKKLAHQSLLEAEHEVAEAKKKEEVANRRYEDEARRTSQEVQSFRYAETRLKAEITHEKAAEEGALASRASVKKLTNVLAVESEKVEESMEVNKNQIRHRMQEAENAREKSKQELVDLERKYGEWQENQRQRAAEVVRKGQDTAMAAEAYNDRQKQVLDSASAQVVQDAEAKGKVAQAAEANSDWADASDFGSDAGFVDENPSFSD